MNLADPAGRPPRLPVENPLRRRAHSKEPDADLLDRTAVRHVDHDAPTVKNDDCGVNSSWGV